MPSPQSRARQPPQPPSPSAHARLSVASRPQDTPPSTRQAQQEATGRRPNKAPASDRLDVPDFPVLETNDDAPMQQVQPHIRSPQQPGLPLRPRLTTTERTPSLCATHRQALQLDRDASSSWDGGTLGLDDLATIAASVAAADADAASRRFRISSQHGSLVIRRADKDSARSRESTTEYCENA